MSKKTRRKKKTAPNKETVFTKEDFLKALKKATRPVTKPKALPSKGKSKTSE